MGSTAAKLNPAVESRRLTQVLLSIERSCDATERDIYAFIPTTTASSSSRGAMASLQTKSPPWILAPRHDLFQHSRLHASAANVWEGGRMDVK